MPSLYRADMSETPYQRRSARVLVVDDADRLLLFHYLRDHRRPELGGDWFTPGGRFEAGEWPAAAAARELHEETGLVVTPEDLGPQVATTSGYADFGWTSGLLRAHFFFHRTAVKEVDTSGQEEHERRQISGHRWWTLDELSSTTETVYPFGLVPLLTDLLAGRIPEKPVRLPLHHPGFS
jgi:8-oxo-dGTP pyrophosphatase MutT (NUDIX family)